MQDERKSWNERYASGSHRSPEPDPFLVESYREYVEPLCAQPGTALDVAGGMGRHAIWLAERGWRVTLVDVSEIAIERARVNAGNLAGQIAFGAFDLGQYKAKPATFDLVLVFFYLERGVFPLLRSALKPGGVLIYKTYTHLAPKFGRGPSHPLHLLAENELLQAFAGFSILHYRETVRDRGIAELVARRLG